ncbi:hypothetical protein BJY52DRAFT_1232949 [Lactarius psammicola]|nr:hypothetical protein BJY52DRAFT_1232949 [Lactarius psammicola]
MIPAILGIFRFNLVLFVHMLCIAKPRTRFPLYILIGFFLYHALRTATQFHSSRPFVLGHYQALATTNPGPYPSSTRHVATRCAVSSSRLALVSSLNNVTRDRLLHLSIIDFLLGIRGCSGYTLPHLVASFPLAIKCPSRLCARQIVYIRARLRVGKSEY